MASGIERFEFEGRLFATVVRKTYRSQGPDFLTEPESPLQLGILTHKKNAEIKAHTHRTVPRTIDKTNEVLYVLEGRVEVIFYSDCGKLHGETILEKGDTILLSDGGHGFRMLEDARILEVKQGPYTGVENDKTLIAKKGENGV